MLEQRLTGRARSVLRNLAGTLVASALAGAIYGVVVWDGAPGHVALGAIASTIAGLLVFGIEYALRFTRLRHPVQRLPFVVELLLRATLYFGALALVVVVTFQVAFGPDPSPADRAQEVRVLVYGFALAFLVNATWQVTRILGPGVLGAYITGRYRTPKEEERVFLLADLVGSTGHAERLGGLRFHALLDSLAIDVGDPIADLHGAIHRFVGDEVIVSWRADAGLRDARCVRAVLAMRRAIAGQGERYRRAFGVQPELRFALHVGPVVTGEIGDLKREIVFLGDTLNVAARIEDATRSLGRPIVASQALVDRLPLLPPGVRLEPIGEHELRGVTRPVPLCALVVDGDA